jgi:hypothetical protein
LLSNPGTGTTVPFWSSSVTKLIVPFTWGSYHVSLSFGIIESNWNLTELCKDLIWVAVLGVIHMQY